jgi:hypothetical protein
MSTTCRAVVSVFVWKLHSWTFTLWCGWTSRNSGGSMLTASCLEILPCHMHHKVSNSRQRVTYDFSLMHEEGMEFFECLLLPENFLGNIKLPGQAFWIPSQAQRKCLALHNVRISAPRDDRWRWYRIAFKDNVAQHRHISFLDSSIESMSDPNTSINDRTDNE